MRNLPVLSLTTRILGKSPSVVRQTFLLQTARIALR